jgi:glutamate/tyrosine decarboxylase-like PLP-dependent enzyme
VTFVRERAWLQSAFAGTAAYLTSPGSAEAWNAHEHVPEISRRFRALAAWCTLRSTGRRGYQEIVERSVINAQSFAAWVAEQPELELLAPTHLNIVCFRLNPLTGDGETDDLINMRAVESIQRGGSAYVTGTRWNGHAAIRAAFDNWATDDADVVALEDAIVRAFPSANVPPS